MRKRLTIFGLAAAVGMLSAGCGKNDEITEEPVATERPAQEDNTSEKEPEMEPEQTTVSNCQIAGGQVALVIDASSAMDSGFNQAALNGAQTYADAAEVSYSYYSADDDTQESYEKAVTTAIQNDAALVICAGSHFEGTVGRMQNEYDDVFFLLLDGVPKDAEGNAVAIAPNVHCITYREEEAGYLAGYMAVLDGYTKLGFIGGEQLPSVERYGYGYLQGIDAAAAHLDNSDDISVEYWYAGTFLPDEQIEETSREWYEAGTEVIFACGGSLYQSVLLSAESCGGKLIGADVDQSDISELILTSAMKGIDSSVIDALDEFFASGRSWPKEIAGSVISYGAKEKCVRLPVYGAAWRFQSAAMSDYLHVIAGLKSGDIQVSDDIDTQPETTVSVIWHEQQEEDLWIPEK
ncbi:MAG: BMP family ABC transporter substrate-binding protein [Lachnospiraceae bacterium]|nr:BMP family ABC transporter substrate-binding protein [Lachnospiraceae bacterium]